jgi:hypothetical protein
MHSGCHWSLHVFHSLTFIRFNANTDLYVSVNKFVL